jgi:hypothetical protein
MVPEDLSHIREMDPSDCRSPTSLLSVSTHGLERWDELKGLFGDGGDMGLCSPPVDNSELRISRTTTRHFTYWSHGLGISSRAILLACAFKVLLSFAINLTKLQLHICTIRGYPRTCDILI